MSDQIEVTTEASEELELESLRSRAKLANLKFHPNMGLEKLRELVNKDLGKAKEVAPVQANTTRLTAAQMLALRNERIRKDATKLIRVTYTNMNPNKSKHKGEIFTAGNSVTGSLKRMIPFHTGEPWFIPQIIINMMKERTYTQWYDAKDEKGRAIKKSRQAKEFSIQVVEAITPKELKELASQQALTNRLAD